MHFMTDLLSRDFAIKSLSLPCPKAKGTFAFAINDDIIVKFPQRKNIVHEFKQDNALLRFLHGKTSLPIPNSKIQEGEYTYSWHKKIPGNFIFQAGLDALPPAKRQKFCDDIAAFVFGLHSMTDEVFNNVYIPYWDRFERYPKPAEIIARTAADKKLSASDRAFLKSFYKKFILANENAIVRFSHFDIMPKNIAFDFKKGKIEGIYDFGDAGIGDIHQDFSQIGLHYGFDTLSKIVARYEKLSGLRLDIDKIRDYSFHSWTHFYMDSPNDKYRAALSAQIKVRQA